MANRFLPIGIQDFEKLRNFNNIYVDKTPYIYELTRTSTPYFLSRPRRFGKSLLSSTLHSFFEGDKELFEGLKVMALEKEWTRYPVLHFDLSSTKHLPVSGIVAELGIQLSQLEAVYGADPAEISPGMRLAGLIRRAFMQTGMQVVVILDEYDAPILDVLQQDDRLHEIREVLQEFYQRLKLSEPFLRFCFITGITKFSQLSIFSTINNLMNVSMDPRFATICGITEQELCIDMREDIEALAGTYGVSPEEMHRRLKRQYDGYHFSKEAEEVYNPFSLLKCFGQKTLLVDLKKSLSE